MRPSPWIRSPAWDGFWMLSGFWLPLLLLALPLATVEEILIPITLSLWIGHRLSSLYLALCVSEYRPVLRAKKGYFFYGPLLLLGVLLLFLLSPDAWLPLPRLQRFLLLGMLDYFFALYHFSVQHYGILAVYRSKLPHGQRAPGLLRWDWWVCLAVSGLFSTVMDWVHGDFEPLHFFRLQNSLFANGNSDVLPIKLVLAALLVLLAMRTLWVYQQRQQGLARSLYFASLCFMTLISFFVAPLLYFAMAQIQHWLVSLGLTTFMARNTEAKHIPNSQIRAETHSLIQLWERFWTAINQRPLAPLLVLILLSISLTPILEADYYIRQGFSTESLNIKGFLPVLRHSIWLYVFGVLAFFSSFVHYIYDRGVFRFSDPNTRQAALKLLQPDQPPV